METRYESLGNIAYEIRSAMLHERLYAKISKFLKGIAICLALAPVASYLNAVGNLYATLLATLAAIVGVVDVLWDPGRKEIEFRHQRTSWEKLNAKNTRFDDAKLAEKISEKRVGSLLEIDALSDLAYNDTLVSQETASKRPLNIQKKLLRFIV